MIIKECEGVRDIIKSTENVEEMIAQILEIVRKDLKTTYKNIFSLERHSLATDAQLNSAIVNISEYTDQQYESDVYAFCRAVTLEAFYQAYSEWCFESLSQLKEKAYIESEYQEIRDEIVKFNYQDLINDLRKIGKLTKGEIRSRSIDEEKAEKFFNVLTSYIGSVRFKDISSGNTRVAKELFPAFFTLLLTIKKTILFKGSDEEIPYKRDALKTLCPKDVKSISLKTTVQRKIITKIKVTVKKVSKSSTKSPTKPVCCSAEENASNVSSPKKVKLVLLKAKRQETKDMIIKLNEKKVSKASIKSPTKSMSCDCLEDAFGILKYLDDLQTYSYKRNGYCAIIKNMIDAKVALDGYPTCVIPYNATLNFYYLKRTSTLVPDIMRSYLLTDPDGKELYSPCTDFYIVLDSLDRSIISSHLWRSPIRQYELQQIFNYVSNLSMIFKELNFNTPNVIAIDPLKSTILRVLDSSNENFEKQSKLITNRSDLAHLYKICYQNIEHLVAAVENYNSSITYDTVSQIKADKKIRDEHRKLQAINSGK